MAPALYNALTAPEIALKIPVSIRSRIFERSSAISKKLAERPCAATPTCWAIL